MHDDYRRDLLTRPSMVAPSLSKAVAGDFAFYAHRHYRRMDDPPSLYPADGFTPFAIADKNKIATPVRKIQAQRLENLFIKGDGLGLLGFLLNDSDMGVEGAM